MSSCFATPAASRWFCSSTRADHSGATRTATAGPIPKGEFGDDETAEAAALREFEEETGFRPAGALLPLGEAFQAGGKSVTAFAIAGDLDATRIESVSCEVEWPPKGGRLIRVLEVDRAEWFTAWHRGRQPWQTL